VIPFTLERYRIVELYAELLHCSNMSLLNRSPSYVNMYDSQGRLQGGLSGLEELAQVIALNSGTDRPNDNMTEEDDDPPPPRDFPVRNPAEISSSPSTLDSDEDMDSEEPGSSDDEAMEEIAMYEDAQLSPIPITKGLPQVAPVPVYPFEAPSLSIDMRDQASPLDISPSNHDSDSSDLASRGSRDKESRRRSRSRRRLTREGSTEVLLPIGEQLKRRLLDENVVVAIIVRSLPSSYSSGRLIIKCLRRIYFLSFPGIISYTAPSTTLCIRS